MAAPGVRAGRHLRAGRGGTAIARVATFAATLTAALAATLLLGGCGGGPAPRLYVLEPVEGRVGPVADAFEAIGIAEVSLPSYARDERIASRDHGIGVELDEDDRWAESPEEAITRVLLASLRRHGGGAVLREPFPRDFEPAARVEIAFDRLLRTPDGGVDTAGRILLLSGDGRRLVDVLPFRITRAAPSRSPSAYFGALAGTIDELARAALARLRDAAPT